METSAKASVNVEEAFHTLARDIKTKTEKKLVSLLKYTQILLFFFLNKFIEYYLFNCIVFNISYFYAVFF